MHPLVTVNILSYNRKDDLRNTLQKVSEQDYKNIEVIVVDNNSHDGSVEMVKLEFPAVRLLELQKNIGIAGWNEGAKIAKGEYLLFLDDDSYPEKNTLLIASPCFRANTILALDIRHPSQPKIDKQDLRKKPYPTFVGCGVIIPSNMFQNLHGFERLLFLYLHEEEFSLRALNSGYIVQYVPNSIVYHMLSLAHRDDANHRRTDKRKQYYFIRNTIILLIFHFPFHNAFPRIIRMSMGWIIFSIIQGGVYSVLGGIIDGVKVTRRNWNHRVIVNNSVVKRYDYGKCFASFFGDGKYAFRRPTWL